MAASKITGEIFPPKATEAEDSSFVVANPEEVYQFHFAANNVSPAKSSYDADNEDSDEEPTTTSDESSDESVLDSDEEYESSDSGYTDTSVDEPVQPNIPVSVPEPVVFNGHLCAGHMEWREDVQVMPVTEFLQEYHPSIIFQTPNDTPTDCSALNRYFVEDGEASAEPQQPTLEYCNFQDGTIVAEVVEISADAEQAPPVQEEDLSEAPQSTNDIHCRTMEAANTLLDLHKSGNKLATPPHSKTSEIFPPTAVKRVLCDGEGEEPPKKKINLADYAHLKLRERNYTFGEYLVHLGYW